MATMTTPAPVRKASKPRPRPERTARLFEVAGQRVLGLTVGRLTTFYGVRPIPSEMGGTAFELEKADQGDGQAPEVYHVLLLGADSRCTCMGHERYGMCQDGRGCKHIAGLQALAVQGRI